VLFRSIQMETVKNTEVLSGNVDVETNDDGLSDDDDEGE